MQRAFRTPRAPDDLLQQRRLARISGLLYLFLAMLGMFAPTVLQSLVVSGDAAATAHNIRNSSWLFGTSLVAWIAIVVCDVALAITLYLLLESVSRPLSLVTAAFRLVYAAMIGTLLLNLYQAFGLLMGGGQQISFLDAQQRQVVALSSLDTFNAGFLLALVFFGVHVVGLGWLLYRSGYVPRAVSGLLLVGGAGYIVHSLANFFQPDGGLASAIVLAPALLGELGLTAWLLVKGINVEPAAALTDSVSPRLDSTDTAAVSAAGAAH